MDRVGGFHLARGFRKNTVYRIAKKFVWDMPMVRGDILYRHNSNILSTSLKKNFAWKYSHHHIQLFTNLHCFICGWNDVESIAKHESIQTSIKEFWIAIKKTIIWKEVTMNIDICSIMHLYIWHFIPINAFIIPKCSIFVINYINWYMHLH